VRILRPIDTPLVLAMFGLRRALVSGGAACAELVGRRPQRRPCLTFPGATSRGAIIDIIKSIVFIELFGTFASRFGSMATTIRFGGRHTAEPGPQNI
jgi:hypothetical protein